MLRLDTFENRLSNSFPATVDYSRYSVAAGLAASDTQNMPPPVDNRNNRTHTDSLSAPLEWRTEDVASATHNSGASCYRIAHLGSNRCDTLSKWCRDFPAIHNFDPILWNPCLFRWCSHHRMRAQSCDRRALRHLWCSACW